MKKNAIGNHYVRMADKDIPVHFDGYAGDVMPYLEKMRAAVELFTPDEQALMAHHLNKIVIRKPVFDILMRRGGYYDSRRGIVMAKAVGTASAGKSITDPFKDDFKAIVSHELNHVLIDPAGKALKDSSAAFEEARNAVCQRLESIPQVRENIQELLDAHRAEIYRNNPLGHDMLYELSIPKNRWQSVEPQNKQQFMAMLGFMLKDSYYLGHYDNRKIQSEILCNLKALASVYGKEAVAEYAPELLHCQDEAVRRSKLEHVPLEDKAPHGILKYFRKASLQER